MPRLVGLVGIILAVTLLSSSIGLAVDHKSDVTTLSPNVRVSNTVVQQKSAEATATSRRVLVDTYCVTCHNQRLKTGDLTLDQIDLDNLAANTETWEKVIRKVSSGLMPPAGVRRPNRDTLREFVESLKTSIDRAAAVSPNPGRPVAHRLNRLEYTNAIRDLLDLDIPSEDLLPADDAGFGFDNIGDVLTISASLLERYLIAAQKISRLAVGDPTIPQSADQYSIPYLSLRQDKRMSEDLPFGSRGGLVARHTFPVDGDYIIKVRLQRNALSLGAMVRGLDVTSVADVRIDGVRVHTFPLGGLGPIMNFSDGTEFGTDYERDVDNDMDFLISVKAGPREVAVTFAENNWEIEGVGPAKLPVWSYGHTAGKVFGGGDYGRMDAGLDHILILGPINGVRPLDTPTRRKIFTCYPGNASEEDACARRILLNLARRAYRRPATQDDVATLFSFYQDGRRHRDFDTGIQWALKRLLTDPEFLVRIEHDPVNASEVFRISDLELASRLSFFLWSSIPDDELFNVAVAGQLHDPVILESQVRRMLADDRSHALLNFFGQWLWVRNMATIRPDRYQFPNFDENLREAFQRETELFLTSQIQEDRPVTELLTANYTFLNERLAEHYGISDIYGNHFRRVSLEGDKRAGLLGHGSVLTVTSYANRTSPVVRGKWVLENLLNTPPPVPPPNVPPFPESEGKTIVSVRERMEQHRKNPVCAACHANLDPLGFALENFDGIGAWREKDGPTTVNAAGAFPDGTKFDGPAKFRAGLMQQQELFLGTVTEKLLTYALGRGVEYYDLPAVRKIIRDISDEENRWSALILGVVNSSPFQMRMRSTE